MPTSLKDLLEEAEAAVPRIDFAAARTMAEKGQALFVDVRDALELEKCGRIAGALHISRGMLEFRADPASPLHDKRLATAKAIVVYGSADGRAALATKTLKDLGYETVMNLGDFKAWVESGGAVEQAFAAGM